MNFVDIGSRRAIIAGAGCVLSAALLVGVSGGGRADAAKSTAKKSAAKSAKAIVGKVVPLIGGRELKGSGECIIEGTLSAKGANLIQTSYRSALKKDKRIVSTGVAAVNNGISVIIMMPYNEIHKISEQLSSQMGMTITLASRGGFKAGQLFPVVPPTSKRVGTGIPVCIMDLVQTENKKTGEMRSKQRYSTWIAQGGMVRIASVGPQRVTFEIKNARFEAMKPPYNAASQARGGFTFNGLGEFLMTEVDDGFR